MWRDEGYILDVLIAARKIQRYRESKVHTTAAIPLARY